MVRGATKHCCWGICKSDSRFPGSLPPSTVFIRFAKPGNIKDSMTEWEKQQQIDRTEKAKRWVHACGRKGFTIKRIKNHTYICSLHFIDGNGPTIDNPDPINATLTNSEIDRKCRKRKAPKPRLPVVSKKRKTNNEIDVSKHGCSNLDIDLHIELTDTMITPLNSTSYGLTDINIDALNSTLLDSLNTNTTSVGIEDKATQTVYDKYVLGAKIDTILLRNQVVQEKVEAKNLSQCKSFNRMSPAVILASESKSKYFIGLYPSQFWALYEFLGPAKFNLKYWNSKVNKSVKVITNECEFNNSKMIISEQLFVTLLRLRRGFNIFTIAHMYDVSLSYVRKIFTTWIMFLYNHFKDHSCLMFPEREVFKSLLPKIFKRFKNIRASVDCTEFKCEVPRDYAQQGNTYSSYKHHTTMKCLIAVNPNGAACFVSDLYEGSIDDVTIFKRCGILNHINPGDSLLVDKGFTIQDLLLPIQATIHIPPFLGKRDAFTKEEVMLTKRIAKARIHVERFNERLKKFRLLDRVIPLVLSPMASQLVYVASCLVNFQECLCK